MLTALEEQKAEWHRTSTQFRYSSAALRFSSSRACAAGVSKQLQEARFLGEAMPTALARFEQFCKHGSSAVSIVRFWMHCFDDAGFAFAEGEGGLSGDSFVFCAAAAALSEHSRMAHSPAATVHAALREESTRVPFPLWQDC